MGFENTATSCSSPGRKPPRLTESSLVTGSTWRRREELQRPGCTSGWRRRDQRSSVWSRCVISRSPKPSARRLQRRSRPRARGWSRSAWRRVEQSAGSRAPLGFTRALRRIRERRKQRLRGVRSSQELYSRAKRGRGSSCWLAGGSYVGFIAPVGQSRGPIRRWRRGPDEARPIRRRSFRGGEGGSDAWERAWCRTQDVRERAALVSYLWMK